MNFSLKKFTESPLFLLFVSIDVLSNMVEKSYKLIEKQEDMGTMLSEIDFSKTYDILIRLVLTFIVWKLYKDFNKFKATTERKEENLNQKIKALTKINHNAHDVLRTLFIESRDRSGTALQHIVKSLNKLGDKSIHLLEESEKVLKYKGKVNEKLDEEETHLYNILTDDTDFKK